MHAKADAAPNFVSRLTKMNLVRTTALRLILALAIGVGFAAYADVYRLLHPRIAPPDFQQPRLAAELLLHGDDPFKMIGPDRPVVHQFYLIYPLTSAVVAMPFTWLPPRIADDLFVGLGAALLAWALTRQTLRNPQLLVFASFLMPAAAQTVQWSPYLTAATMIPWLGVLYACKPSVGLAYLIAYPSRIGLAAASALTLVTLTIWPWWPGEWLAELGTVTHMSAPVMRPGGVLLLLALLRWRRPEARLLAALACIPQTPVLYEALPLFLIVSTLKEGIAMAILTVIAARVTIALGIGLEYDAWMTLSGRLMLWLVYLPFLALVLRRPNVWPARDTEPIEQPVQLDGEASIAVSSV